MRMGACACVGVRVDAPAGSVDGVVLGSVVGSTTGSAVSITEGAGLGATVVAVNGPAGVHLHRMLLTCPKCVK